MEYIFLLKYIYSSSWKLLPVKEELCRDKAVRGGAEARKASQPRTAQMALGPKVWRENRRAREGKSAGAACSDEGADYEGYVPESPAAIGGGRFIP